MKTSTCRPVLVVAVTLTAAGMTLVEPATVVGRQAPTSSPDPGRAASPVAGRQTTPELVWETGRALLTAVSGSES